MTYCYKCQTCGARWESQHSGIQVCAYDHEPGKVIRDYRAENVGIGEGVRESRREHTNSGYRDLFLPTADDYAGPDDPSGQKGLREWAETHGPREDNKRPMWPEMDKKVFPTS